MPEVSFVGLDVLVGKAMAGLERGVVQSAEHLVGESMAAAPVRTGTLRASIHVDDVQVGADSVTARVATGGEANAYAIPVHEGTHPHTIEARDAHALSWPGAEHPVKSVHHPGTKATKFMERPLLANRAVYEAVIADAVRGEF